MSFKPPHAWRAAFGPAGLVFDFKIKAQDLNEFFLLIKGDHVFQAAACVAGNIRPCGPCV